MVLVLVGLTGCGVLNPKVEFGKRKVPDFPEYTTRQQEALKDAAWAAAEISEQTVVSAVAADRPSEEIRPLEDVARLTGSVSEVLGPPRSLPLLTSDAPPKLSEKLLELTAKHDREIQQYKDKIEGYEGKKIEGTGIIQTHQWTILIVSAVGLFVFAFLWNVVAGIMQIANPAIGVGMSAAGSAVSFGAGQLQKAFVQVLKGGENFKKKVDAVVQEQQLDKKTAEAIVKLFTREQQQAQDQDVQVAVRTLTNQQK